VETLPQSQQQELMTFLADRMRRPPETATLSEDPVEEVIGAFSGPMDATGRKAEEIAEPHHHFTQQGLSYSCESLVMLIPILDAKHFLRVYIELLGAVAGRKLKPLTEFLSARDALFEGPKRHSPPTKDKDLLAALPTANLPSPGT
jgi:hypothetical protein